MPCALHVAHIVLTKVSKLFTQIMAQSKEAASSLATHILQVGKTKNEAHALVAARWVHNTFAGEQALKGHLDECGSNLPLYRAQTARWASQIRNLKWILYQSRPLAACGAVFKVSDRHVKPAATTLCQELCPEGGDLDPAFERELVLLLALEKSL